MYFALGWPKSLVQTKGGGSPLKYLVCNRYRMLFAILTDETISIWHCRPCVEILCYQRGSQSVSEMGPNSMAEWRHDSSMLAVATTTGHLLIYQLEQDVKAEKGVNLYECNQNKTPQGENSDGVPALRLCLKATIEYDSPVVSLSCVSDDLLVATSSGELELLPWFGSHDVRKSINIQDMTFSVDLHSAGSIIRSKHPMHITQLTYSPCLEGFTAILSDGRAALSFITKSTEEGSDKNAWKAHGIWANGLTKAICGAVNNRYRLMAFGTARGSCEVYSMDDVLGSLQFSHQMTLSPKHYPDVYRNTGSVLDMQWTPDGCALALSWQHGGFSLWSVYGACLVCTLSADHAFTADGSRKQQSLFYSMCWGAEGYQLWLIQENMKSSYAKTKRCNSVNHTDEFCAVCESVAAQNSQVMSSSSSEDGFSQTSSRLSDVSEPVAEETHRDREFIQIQFVKSALTMNPCSGNHSHVILQGEDRMFLSYGEKGYSNLVSGAVYDERKKRYITKMYLTPDCPERNFETIVGNKQWTIVQLPINYLNGNWPIRFSCIDKSGKLLAIAGNFGIAHYSQITRKWKLFGNIMQEKDMVVTGGLAWWDGLIIVACYNLVENQDELRIYPHYTNLDNVFSYVKRVNSQVLLINIYLNMVIIFDATCHIKIFHIKKEDKIQYMSASLTLLKDISMQRYVPYPSLVISVMMASLHMESSGRKHSVTSQHETEVLIINVAGRLLLLQHCVEETTATVGSTTSRAIGRELNFHPPIVLASSVENIWTSEYKNSQKVHLTDALWLSCGSAGVRVWLPLFPPIRRSRSGDVEQHDMQALLSKRITLTLEMDSCYPLAVLFENAVVIGVKSETFQHQRFSESLNHKIEYNFPFSTLERTCEIYLHQILRQLLRRNLGYHALQVASSCRSLSYFPHVLELMLHKVLEEEATASAPIPDPLLPTIVKFIAEFPEYLETIVHCARKTEIALWQYLFSSVGNPKELFEECLETDQLQTAASYLIILQNLEKLTLARQDATRLLSKALNVKMWSLAADIIRFLRAIGDGDVTTAPRHPVLLNSNIYPAVATHLSMEEDGKFNDKKASERVPTTGEKIQRHGRTSSNYYELYGQKSGSTAPTHQTTEYSSSYHPYVPQYPVNSYARRRPLQASLSHPASLETTPVQKGSEANKLPTLHEQGLTAECAEHYFIDVILSRQARQLLSEKNLLELCTFAAHLEFDLVPWLQKEKNRAARITDAVECLVAIHSNFSWPYPSLVRQERPSLNSLKQSSSRNNSMNLLPNASERGSRDSLSSSTSEMLTVLSISDTPQRNASENYEMSDTSSINDDISSEVLEGIYDNYVIDKNSGSPQTREQLMYLFDLMLKSACLEWALLLCLALGDQVRLSLVLDAVKGDKRGHSIKLEALQRTRDCIAQIRKWAPVDCPCYEQVLFAMDVHFSTFHDIVNEREIEYAEKQAIIAQQKAQASRSESMDRSLSKPAQSASEDEKSENSSDEVFSGSMEEKYFKASPEQSPVSEEANGSFPEGASEVDGTASEDEAKEESCAVS